MNIERMQELKELINKLEGMARQKDRLNTVSSVVFKDSLGDTIMSIRGKDSPTYINVAIEVIEEQIKELTNTLKQEFGVDINDL